MAPGALLGEHWLRAAGILALAHAGFDRMLGHGLKPGSGFRDTHPARIGRNGCAGVAAHSRVFGSSLRKGPCCGRVRSEH
ncbi:MAG: DUF4260 family protein [Rhodobacter sp.]|nr:DUF4260 family protein [Rhodobacter sp.]MCA3512212.1 DUF4260 family protein [Rhodobacter sp.]MCA3519899.1 DUF4260 family protein [Rhodobacter sp.]MCA3522892.1 DUF4260 family protein [Rhodobacter sp.]MCA3525695.1 DUF4260 family protein [Rhodobacter sp.]